MTDRSTMSVHSVEDLARVISELRRAPGEERDAVTLCAGRVHLARNADNCIEVFIEGSRESFAQSVIGRGLEFGRYTDAKNDRQFPALVIRAGPGPAWERPMAHLAYEAVQAIYRHASITNEELLAGLGPYLRIVSDKHLLSAEQQMGLTGELIFLHELLNAASAFGVSSRMALECWTGWESASRDFKGGAIAVEVKATGGTSRQHWVHPMYQVLAAPESQERVFVYSIGLRGDRSRDYKLTTAVSRVLEDLPVDVHEVFRQRLEQYGGTGFSYAEWRQYELESGFIVTLAPSLFRVDQISDLLRPESFVGGGPPSRVIDLRYVLSLEGLPVMSQPERDAVFRELLSGAP